MLWHYIGATYVDTCVATVACFKVQAGTMRRSLATQFAYMAGKQLAIATRGQAGHSGFI